jgi:hypothetical protein
MNCFNVCEALEVSRVEGEDVLHVIHLGSGDGMSNEEPAPDEMHSGIVGEHWDLVFDHPRSPISFQRRQAEAVAIQRPC